MDPFISLHFWKLICIGLIIGMVSGGLGVGSGIILIPALVILMEIPQKNAQGTALAVMVTMALMGSLRYYWNPSIKLHLPMILLLSITAVIGANIGSSLAFMTSASILRKSFAIFMVVVGVRMFFK